MLTKCALCGGDIRQGKAEKVIRVENDVVIVLVDAEVCQQCGEAYYTPKTVEKLEELRKRLKEKVKIDELCIPAGQTYLYNGKVEA